MGGDVFFENLTQGQVEILTCTVRREILTEVPPKGNLYAWRNNHFWGNRAWWWRPWRLLGGQCEGGRRGPAPSGREQAEAAHSAGMVRAVHGAALFSFLFFEGSRGSRDEPSALK